MMKKLVQKYKILLLGGIFFLLGLILMWFVMKPSKEKTSEDSQIINMEIKRLNKMIVVEQNFSEFKTKKYERFNAKYFDFLNKDIILYITAKAQVTYDMKKMNLDVDSVNKKIIIKEIPEAEISVYPEVKIYDMKEGFLNDFSKTELNEVMESGKQEIRTKVNNSNLKQIAREQLIANLKDLFVVAKLYKWQVVDETGYYKEIVP